MPAKIYLPDRDVECIAYLLHAGDDAVECGWSIVEEALRADWMMHLSLFSSELQNRARIGVYDEEDSFTLFIAVDTSDVENLPSGFKSLLIAEGWRDYPLGDSDVGWSLKSADIPSPVSIEFQLRKLLRLFTCRGLMSIRFPNVERSNRGS